ncbi:phosphoglycerate mutase-like protein [Cantharellus anzutake]|uniref:phosphoglycerate mutase-like protein n=1 Tax=Cantharellus anzutake TaxID=1750568 RepID=UPI00190890F5|nr:phosphoglycerate mutase-like protein [Cantharellus anzutake]KAF8333105.1 phosphoglycerate mutase-like protein [Cantharellus anzutake]
MATASKVIGVLVLSLFGDRIATYDDPTTYRMSSVNITTLGQTQEYRLGQLLWQTYFNHTSLSYLGDPSPISALVASGAVRFDADMGGQGHVIYDSAVALSQGMWPPVNIRDVPSITLANGSTIKSPLGGFRFTSINQIHPWDDVSLEGWLECPNFETAMQSFYSSSGFRQVEKDNEEFLSSLSYWVGNRSTSLSDIKNLYDYLSIRYIHDAAFSSVLPSGVLNKARQLASYHESGVYTSTDLNSTHNVPGRALLPKILNAIEGIANKSNPLKFYSMSLSHQPLMSLLSMMGVSESYANLTGLFSQAGSIALEVRTDNDGENPFIQFLLKNGTSDPHYSGYALFGGSPDISVSKFESMLQPFGLSTLSSWCGLCGTHITRGCGSTRASNNADLSSVAAGLMGAGATLFVALMLVTLCVMVGLLKVGEWGKRLGAVIVAPMQHSRKGSNVKSGGEQSENDDEVRLARKWEDDQGNASAG